MKSCGLSVSPASVPSVDSAPLVSVTMIVKVSSSVRFSLQTSANVSPSASTSPASKPTVSAPFTTEVKIVILTTYGTSAELAEAVRNGAVATLLKDTAARNIVNDIRSVVAGKVIIPERLLQQIEEDNAMDKLTPRQL